MGEWATVIVAVLGAPLAAITLYLAWETVKAVRDAWRDRGRP